VGEQVLSGTNVSAATTAVLVTSIATTTGALSKLFGTNI
jgi:hypothetical protein